MLSFHRISTNFSWKSFRRPGATPAGKGRAYRFRQEQAEEDDRGLRSARGKRANGQSKTISYRFKK